MKSIIRQYLWNLFINGILNSYFMPICVRVFVLNIIGAKVHGAIHAKCILLSHRINLGKGSFINRRSLLDNGNAWITIGNNVAIGCNVSLLTTNHMYNDGNRRGGQISPKTVIIEDAMWIGANSIILPGTIIRKGCVIAAGSVVRGETKSNCVYAGNPAIFIKEL